jgi:imidazolonepropionase-like amidohydrolase
MATAQTPPPALNVYAIVGAKIEVGDGRIIDKGTVLIRDGIIEAVGPTVPVPPEAQIIKGDGLVVYPGFIDGHSTRGLQPPDPQPNQDTPPDANAMAPPFMREANRKGIRPELQADSALALTDDLLRPARQAGFTTELLVPSGGTITGIGSLVNLSGEPKRDCVVRPAVAMGFTFTSTGGRGFGGGGGGGYPGSLMGITALTRQTLLDARHYELLQTAFAHGGSRRAPDDAVLASLQGVLHGDMPVIYDADNENEIRRAIKMADEFGLKLMLSGAGEGWKAASLLTQKHIPVLLTLNFGPDPTAPPQATGGFGGRPGGFGGGAGGRGRNRQGGTPPNGAPAGAGTPGGAPAAGTNRNQGAAAQQDAVPQRPFPGGAPGGFPGGGAPGAPDAARPAAIPVEDDTPKAYKEEQHRKWLDKVANAAQLVKAGVPIAFSTNGTRSATEFFTNLRQAIKAGLPRAAALRALTIDAAKLFGVDRQLGTVEVGKTAAVIVMTGDFADERSRTRYVFIDRAKFDLENDTGPIPAAPARFFPADDDEDGGHE